MVSKILVKYSVISNDFNYYLLQYLNGTVCVYNACILLSLKGKQEGRTDRRDG